MKRREMFVMPVAEFTSRKQAAEWLETHCRLPKRIPALGVGYTQLLA